MDRFKLLLKTAWFGCLLTFVPALALAGDLKIIAEELRPVSGYVVMSVNGEYLIDLDASHGLQIGDLVSVVAPGEKIIHPVTNKVIGTLDESKAVLKVTRLNSGYSYTRRIAGDKEIAKGEPVRRFAGLTAALYAPQGRGEQLYDRLRELLPELVWQGRFSSGQTGSNGPDLDMSFMLEGQDLRLLDREGEQLRTYSVALASPGKPILPETAQAAPLADAQQAATINSASGNTAVTFPGATGDVDFGGLRHVAAFPGRVLMASFLNARDRLLVATVDGSRVRVYAVSDQLQPLGETRVRGGIANPLAVNWWQPEQNGPLYLAVTASVVKEKAFGNIKETSLGGAIYQWDGHDLSPVVTTVPYFLGSLDRNGDGQPETLLGQEFDLQQVYGRVFELRLDNSDLKSQQPSFSLPAKFALPGSTMGDLTGDGQPEFITVSNTELKIFSGSRKLYQSPGQMGGSLASLTYDINPGVTDTLFETVSLEIQPVVNDIDGDGIAELLVVASETSALKIPGIGPGINSSWIAVIKYRNGMFDKGRLRFDRESPLQGLWSEPGKVYLVESQTTSILSQEGNSHLLVFPLTSGGPR